MSFRSSVSKPSFCRYLSTTTDTAQGALKIELVEAPSLPTMQKHTYPEQSEDYSYGFANHTSLNQLSLLTALSEQGVLEHRIMTLTATVAQPPLPETVNDNSSRYESGGSYIIPRSEYLLPVRAPKCSLATMSPQDRLSLRCANCVPYRLSFMETGAF